MLENQTYGLKALVDAYLGLYRLSYDYQYDPIRESASETAFLDLYRNRVFVYDYRLGEIYICYSAHNGKLAKTLFNLICQEAGLLNQDPSISSIEAIQQVFGIIPDFAHLDSMFMFPFYGGEAWRVWIDRKKEDPDSRLKKSHLDGTEAYVLEFYCEGFGSWERVDEIREWFRQFKL